MSMTRHYRDIIFFYNYDNPRMDELRVDNEYYKNNIRKKKKFKIRQSNISTDELSYRHRFEKNNEIRFLFRENIVTHCFI